MTSESKERVVVTGLGLLTPLGLGKEATLAALREGRCGIRFGDAESVLGAGFWPTHYGVCEGFEAARYIADKKSIRSTTRRIHLAVAAARLALEDADWAAAQRADQDEYSAGTLVAVGSDDALDAFFPVVQHSMTEAGEFDHGLCGTQGVSHCPPLYILPRLPNTAAGQIAIQNTIKGLNYSVVNVANGGVVSIGEAYRAIRNGRATRMISGAATGPLGAYATLERDVLDKRLSNSKNGSRAFSADSDGLILAEGAALLVLESESSAKARGARIYAEITAYANTYDVAPETTVETKQAGYVRAMRATLAAAELTPGRVSAISASGIGLPVDDAAEVAAIREVFSGRLESLPVSATKNQTGYIEAVSGALEVAVAALSVSEGFVPPTIRLDSGAQEPELDYVPERGRPAPLEHVLCMSYEPCGSNVGLIISKYGR